MCFGVYVLVGAGRYFEELTEVQHTCVFNHLYHSNTPRRTNDVIERALLDNLTKRPEAGVWKNAHKLFRTNA